MSAQFRMRSFNSPNGIPNSGGHCLSRAFDWVFKPPRFATQAGGRAQLVQESFFLFFEAFSLARVSSAAASVFERCVELGQPRPIVRQGSSICHGLFGSTRSFGTHALLKKVQNMHLFTG